MTAVHYKQGKLSIESKSLTKKGESKTSIMKIMQTNLKKKDGQTEQFLIQEDDAQGKLLH